MSRYPWPGFFPCQCHIDSKTPCNCPHPPMAQLNANQHAKANPGTNSYSDYGPGVTFRTIPPAFAQAYHMQYFAADVTVQSTEIVNQKLPFASATYLAPGSVKDGAGHSRHGYQLYAGTSLPGGKKKMANIPPTLLPSLAEGHAKDAKCAEVHVLSSHVYANGPSTKHGGYMSAVVTATGESLPPCGHKNPKVKPGCRHCLDYLGVQVRQ